MKDLRDLNDLTIHDVQASAQFKNIFFTEMCSGSETGSYLRLTDSITSPLQTPLYLHAVLEAVQRRGEVGLAGGGVETLFRV